MTLFLNHRAYPVAGPIAPPRLMRGNLATAPHLKLVPDAEIAGLVAGKDVLFAVHGFNVNQADGIKSLAILDTALELGPSVVVIGVLWPGDFWIPAINYPFEGDDAMQCGRALAEFCNSNFGRAASLSFVSHSLGARLVLEAVEHLAEPRRMRMVCLTAAAINRDCLETEYSASAKRSDAIRVLASHEDWVLRLAYPIGDPISDVLHDDHTFFEKALGYDGPSPGSAPMLGGPWQIPDGYDYTHASYLPPRDPERWPSIAEYVRRVFLRLPDVQPSPFPPPA